MDVPLGEWFCQICEPTETDVDDDIIIEYDKVRILREGNKNLKKKPLNANLSFSSSLRSTSFMDVQSRHGVQFGQAVPVLW